MVHKEVYYEDSDFKIKLKFYTHGNNLETAVCFK